MSIRLLWTLVALFALVKMALVGWWPFLSLTHLQHDTQIFINQAITILEGNWVIIFLRYYNKVLLHHL